MTYSTHIKQILTDRAVDLEVAAVRHREYHDLNDVYEADPNYRDLESTQRRFLARVTSSGSGGLAMVRHAPPGIGTTPPLFAELRPADKIRTGTRRHNFVDKNGRMWHHHDTDAQLQYRGWQDHVARSEQADDHHGTNDPDDHQHVVWAKYLFPPGGRKNRPWRHRPKVVDGEPAWYHEHPDQHVTKRHTRGRGLDDQILGEHQHFDHVKDPAINRAKRLDVHPWAVPLFKDASIVFCAMESVIKSDAILSDILERGAPEAVFDFASVTLWDCKELAPFTTRYLRGKTVVLVPDSDWADVSKRGAIWAQTLMCRTRLEEIAHLGSFPITVVVAAPSPEPAYCAFHDKPAGSKRGADDYRRDGGQLADMVVIDRRLPVGLDWESGAAYERGRQADQRVLRFLSLHAAEDGTLRMPLATMAKGARVDVKSVKSALQRLVQTDAVKSDVPVETSDGRWVPWPVHDPYRTGAWWLAGLDWEEMPTLTLSPLLRSWTDSSKTVGDLNGRLA